MRWEGRRLSGSVFGQGALGYLVEPAAVHVLLEPAIPLISNALFDAVDQRHYLILSEAVVASSISNRLSIGARY